MVDGTFFTSALSFFLFYFYVYLLSFFTSPAPSFFSSFTYTRSPNSLAVFTNSFSMCLSLMAPFLYNPHLIPFPPGLRASQSSSPPSPILPSTALYSKYVHHSSSSFHTPATCRTHASSSTVHILTFNLFCFLSTTRSFRIPLLTLSSHISYFPSFLSFFLFPFFRPFRCVVFCIFYFVCFLSLFPHLSFILHSFFFNRCCFLIFF